MKKLSLNDFAKANVAIAKKVMMSVKGGDADSVAGKHFKEATLTM